MIEEVMIISKIVNDINNDSLMNNTTGHRAIIILILLNKHKLKLQQCDNNHMM